MRRNRRHPKKTKETTSSSAGDGHVKPEQPRVRSGRRPTMVPRSHRGSQPRGKEAGSVSARPQASALLPALAERARSGI